MLPLRCREHVHDASVTSVGFNQEGDLEQALEMVRSSRAIPRTRELAEKFARESRESITWMVDSPSKAALLELPDFVLSRLY